MLLKGKFFSEDNMKLVGSPCFANILLLLNIFSVHRDSKMFAKYGDPTSNIISSEKNLPLPKTAPNEGKTGEKMPTKQKMAEKEDISEPEKVERKEPIKEVSEL